MAQSEWARTMVSLSREDIETARPLLKREGLSVSSFCRKSIADYIDAHKNRNRVINIEDVEALR